MKTIVLKFGGTSMQTVQIIKHVAKIIQGKTVKNSNDFSHNIVVVVSAMSQHTNQLVQWVNETENKETSNLSNATYQTTYQEYWNKDFVIASGEQITAGLLALCLQEIGIKALALAGWQIPIITNKNWSNAKIEHINTDLFQELFANNIIPIVTGFQGITYQSNIIPKPFPLVTTLGRGGSDTTAVALACALKADQCDIFTDVPGIFTADPNLLPQASLIPEIDYLFLEQLTNAGAKVVHPEAAKLAREYKINMNILSTFAPDKQGTKVVDNHTKNTCFVHKEIIGLTFKTQDLPSNAISYTYNPSNQIYTGFFFKKPSLDVIQSNISYFKAYLITILNPDMLITIDIENLLLSAKIKCFYQNKINDQIIIIIPEKDLVSTLHLLHQAIYYKM